MSAWARIEPGTPLAEPRAADGIEIEAITGAPNHGIPNNPDLPALIYRRAFSGPPAIECIKALYEKNGWFRVWDYVVLDYHHFHPNAHEALSVARGTAHLHLGGEDGPVVEVRAGDALILPAGFGHKTVSMSDDFRIVGGYPEGQEERDLLPADPVTCDAHLESVRRVPLPHSCPIYGADGPLVRRWT